MIKYINNILPSNYISETETNLYFDCSDHIEKYTYFPNENDLYKMEHLQIQ